MGRTSRNGRWAALACAAAAAAGMAAAPPARAGEYAVDVCKDWATNGPLATPPANRTLYLAGVDNQCAANGSLAARLFTTEMPAGEASHFGYAVSGTSPNIYIKRIQARYSAKPATGNALSAQLVAAGEVLETSAAPGVWDLDKAAPAGTREVLWRLACGLAPADGACTFATVDDALELVKARLTVEEGTAPAGAADGGSALTAGAQSGTRAVVVDASDGDSGVKRLVARLGTTVVGEATSTCTTTSFSPCPKSRADVTVPVDTTLVADGSHALSIVVEDAAANTATVAAGTITVDNVPPPTATRAPLLSGTATEGQTLVLDPGSWDGHGRGVTLEYLWQRSADGVTWVDVAPSPADATRYVLTGADVGRMLRAVVRATSPEGAKELSGGTTAPVAAAPASGTGGGSAGGGSTGGDTTGGGSTVGGSTGGGSTGGGSAPGAGAPTPGAPAGDGASPAAGSRLSINSIDRRRAARIRYGRRVPVTGTFVDPTGRALPGARIEVHEVRAGRERHAATVLTDPSGRFSYVPPTGPSRTLRFSYRAADGSFSHVQEVSLKVVAAVSLGADRRKLRNGQAVTFRGALRGSRGRKVVELQVRRGSGWLTFATVVSHDGRFRHRYRFLRTWWTQAYTFRARVRKQDGFPYETGTSAQLRVKVRGTGLPRE